MGIDAAFLETGESRGVKFGNRPITILSNRNLLPIYNVSLLIRAIPIVLKEEPETRFRIAGDGTERKALEREVESLNINPSVEFLGRVPHEEMPILLSQADIYVSTSLHDGTSVSLLEAMGSGAFPVVTDIPANREWIIDGENGFLVAEDEKESLASKIIEAIRNRELLGKSRTKNRLIVEQKALWPGYISRIKNIYISILNS
jgi:glycosyltransferase involved in cell wall biosynthesis